MSLNEKQTDILLRTFEELFSKLDTFLRVGLLIASMAFILNFII